ncbi:hypothetical protein BD311DRAFT_744495 [Dichomitus squalens]|uniref:Uncharacterized protein n=1 Tax=Dichomitus squalens TaxID=114155 RepID=A0A4Q9M436_9APHY|nr:hypothetical protein BD311DRAFT_771836 [Dichomitus squalens]TBU35729.1 hypothetical protein BD311DRAFT_744495 [Dichomitus squalens]
MLESVVVTYQAAQMEVQAQGTSIEPLSHNTIVSKPSHTWPKFKDADLYRQWYGII